MLHILLLILKIIGILMLVLFILLFLLFLTVSFSPLIYRGEASCRRNPDTLFSYVKFYWLFHLISGEIIYRNGEIKWRIRAAWKRMGDVEEKTAEEGGSEPTEEKNEAEAETLENKIRASEEAKISETDRDTEKKQNFQSGLKSKEFRGDLPNQKPETEQETKPTPSVPEKHLKKFREEHRIQKKKIRKKKAKKEALPKYVEKCIKRMKYTFQNFCDKIKALNKKKDRLKAFAENEVHRKAFVRAAGELKRFFCFVRPQKINVHIQFGCRNPEYTGYILAGISMIYPLIGECMELQPDFERRILKGNAIIKGKFRIIYILIIAGKLICDKNVRTTYRHIRKFRL